MARLRTSRIAIVGMVLAVGAAGYFFVSQTQRERARAAATAAEPAVIPVTVGTAERKDMPVYVRGIGTVQAYNTVTVQSRVDGEIMAVAFEEGQEVKAGDPLFQIDPRPFQAALDRARANKQRDEAALIGAQADLDRYGALLTSGFQSRQSFDEQKAIVDALKGSISAHDAAIETARLNLAYADLQAPISGRTGARLVDRGNLVRAERNTPLVTITQIRPIYVSFTVPQINTDRIRANQTRSPNGLEVLAFDREEKTELARGKLTLIDNQIAATTGTLRLKGTFENADQQLWPGQFVTVRLILDTRKDAVVVPRGAVMRGANDSYVYVVKADRTAERRSVEVAATQDGQVVIAKGLAVGEQVVMDGQYRLTNGARIRTAAQP